MIWRPQHTTAVSQGGCSGVEKTILNFPPELTWIKKNIFIFLVDGGLEGEKNWLFKCLKN